MMPKLLWLLVILLCGFFLRVMTLDYGITERCLVPEQEFWLTETTYTSAYAIDPTNNYLNVTLRELTSQEHVMLRYAGMLAGVVTIAITIRLLKVLRTSIATGVLVLVAVSPWFVTPDRWVVAFDVAPLLVSLSMYSIWTLRYRTVKQWLVWLTIFASLSLLFVAPPLWWLTILLLLAVPQVPYRKIGFAFFVIFVLVAGIRNPLAWYQATQLWDSGTTAALVWLVIVTFAFYTQAYIPKVMTQVVVVIAMLSGAISLIHALELPRPTDEQKRVISVLQDAIPDNTSVALAPSLYPFVPIIECPMEVNIIFEPKVYTPIVPLDENFITVVEGFPNTPLHVQQVDEKYWIVRNLELANPIYIPVRDQLVVLNAELLSPTLLPGGILDVRLDMQFTSHLNEQFSVYGLFVHVTLPDQSAEKLVQFGYPIGQEMGTIHPRDRAENYHVRLALPNNIPSGSYDVIIGFSHNVEAKEITRLTVGRVEVVAP
jgi:hypothetical protein